MICVSHIPSDLPLTPVAKLFAEDVTPDSLEELFAYIADVIPHPFKRVGSTLVFIGASAEFAESLATFIQEEIECPMRLTSIEGRLCHTDSLQ